jgi:hypothetical protein
MEKFISKSLVCEALRSSFSDRFPVMSSFARYPFKSSWKWSRWKMRNRIVQSNTKAPDIEFCLIFQLILIFHGRIHSSFTRCFWIINDASHANVETAIAVQHGNPLQFQLFSFFVSLFFDLIFFILNKYCCAALWVIFLPCLGNIIRMWRALYGI